MYKRETGWQLFPKYHFKRDKFHIPGGHSSQGNSANLDILVLEKMSIILLATEQIEISFINATTLGIRKRVHACQHILIPTSRSGEGINSTHGQLFERLVHNNILIQI